MEFWLIIGLTGQLLFGMRFVIQWICSEKKKESYIPVIFWWFSLAGGAILLVYSIYRQDPVFIIGQSMGLMIYIRNLTLIYKKINIEGIEIDEGSLRAQQNVREDKKEETGISKAHSKPETQLS